LEHTIGYEQLAVDLTAELAKRECDCNVKKALDFALLEDFDHLYRYADLLEMEAGTRAESLVGGYTEIMPARPTIAHHRYPFDSIKQPIDSKTADPMTKLCVGIITAAEQQTMNYYMNVCAAYPNTPGRALYREIGMVEEQHVSHYGSLMDVRCTWYENLLMHQYTECYLYWSCCETETDGNIRRVWERMFEMELSHLQKAVELLRKLEQKEYQQVVGEGTFPSPLKLESNIDHVRKVLSETVQLTACRESYAHINDLENDADFFRYQKLVNPDVQDVASHSVIERLIRKNGQDYRFELSPNPIETLRCRTEDNTEVGRKPLNRELTHA
jgi:rubrerythrin